jgi:predicted HicB family RNase H-like nuclease
MGTMTLDGYVAVVTLDADADIFHGEVVNTRDVLTFQGRSPEELRQAFRDTLDDYFAWCRERGKTPDRPYSGTLSLRIGPELHRRAALAAARRGRTLNAFIKDQIEKVASES